MAPGPISTPAKATRANSRAAQPSVFGCSAELVKQRLCFFQVARVGALGEPVIDGRKNIARLGTAALVGAEPGKARSGTQFPELGLLLPSDAQGFTI